MPQDRKIVPTKLFVGNISHAADNETLRKEFEQYGNVVECDILRDYGFVHFEHESEAEQALQALNGVIFLGSKLRVEKSSSYVRHKPGSSNSDTQTCYFCGEAGHWAKDCTSYTEKNTRPRKFTNPPPRGYPEDRYAYRRPYPYDDDDPYRRPYPPRDPYYDYPPPPPRDPYYRDRYDPYERLPPPRPYYAASRDPNRRPPPEYYGASSRYSEDYYPRARPRPY